MAELDRETSDMPPVAREHLGRLEKAGAEWRETQFRLDDTGLLLLRVLRPREAAAAEAKPRATHEFANLIPKLVVELLRRSLPRVRCVERFDDQLTAGEWYPVVPSPHEDRVYVINDQGDWFPYDPHYFEPKVEHPEPITDELVKALDASGCKVMRSSDQWRQTVEAFRLGCNVGHVAAHGELDTAIQIVGLMGKSIG